MGGGAAVSERGYEMDTIYWIVTPYRRWESQRPAVHLCEHGNKRTLCGKLADNWMLDNWAGSFNPDLVNCITCKRIYERTRAGESA